MSRPVSQIIADVLTSVGLEALDDDIFSSTNDTAREVVVALNETIAEILESHDWRAVTRYHTIVGNGVLETIDLPDDFIRMPKGARVWSDRLGGSYTQIVDADTWLGLETRFQTIATNCYIITDDQIALRPAPGLDEVVRFAYVSDLSVKNGSTYKNRFDNPNDLWLMDDRLLQLGLTYHLRMEQGLNADHEGRKFAMALEKAISRDKGPRILKQATSLSADGYDPAFPGTIIA